MNPYLQEVLDAHVLIERWLSQGEGSAEALMSVLPPNSMIPLSGEKMDYPTVSRFSTTRQPSGITHRGGSDENHQRVARRRRSAIP
jgi:hypothetical protein